MCVCSQIVSWRHRERLEVGIVALMGKRVDSCRRQADDCQRAAARVNDPHIQAKYREMCRQWHEMAKRQQAIDEALAGIGTA